MTTDYINNDTSLDLNRKVLIDANVLLDFCLCDYRCKSWIVNDYFLKFMGLIKEQKFFLIKEIADEFEQDTINFTKPHFIEHWNGYKERYPKQLQTLLKESPIHFTSIMKELEIKDVCDALVKQVVATKRAIKKVHTATKLDHEKCKEALRANSFNTERAIIYLKNNVVSSNNLQKFSTMSSDDGEKMSQKYGVSNIEVLVDKLTSTLKKESNKNWKTDALLTLYAVLGNFNISTSDRAIIHALKSINKEHIVIRPHFLVNYWI